MNDAAPRSEEIRLRFLKVDTSNVADVLDDMDLPDQGLAADFKPYPASAGKLAGWAYTIRGQMAPYSGTGDAEKMRACQGLTPGDVSVWSGDGEGICYFGELIAVGMKDRGSVGALVDGGVRDIRWLRQLGYPVYARYRTPVQSIGRWKVVEWQKPVPTSQPAPVIARNASLRREPSSSKERSAIPSSSSARMASFGRVRHR